jgi:PTH1 family peptidyl-tRNA hydrolase
MKLIVGLGNPGKKYTGSRHNVGFMAIDTLVSQISNFQFPISSWEESINANALYCSTRLKGQKIEFVKPQTFMNNSGYSVKYAYKKHSLKPKDIYVVHDDLDLVLGSYKIQKGKGPREHGGLLSIEKELKTTDFWRVRIGIENRTEFPINSRTRISGEEYVLQNFTEEESVKIDAVIKEVVKELINRLRD